jgi:AAA ATPase domain
MDQRLNPYTPGSGVKPLKLAGRDQDIEAFRVLLERLADGRPERSLIYSGLRGVGKTVLLLEFETLTREHGWVCNDVEEVGSGDFRQMTAASPQRTIRTPKNREKASVIGPVRANEYVVAAKRIRASCAIRQ